MMTSGKSGMQGNDGPSQHTVARVVVSRAARVYSPEYTMKAITGSAVVSVYCLLSYGIQVSAAEPEEANRTAMDRQAAVTAFETQYPEARFLNVEERTTRIYGTVMARGASPEDTAERFRQRHAAILGVSADSLDPRGPLADRRHTQPLMYDRNTGQYKFTLVYYTQRKSDIPVFRADLRLLVRNEPGHPLVLAANGLRDLGSFAPNPHAARDSAKGIAAAKEAIAGLTHFTPPELVIWAGVDGMIVAPTVAYEFIGDSGTRTGANVEKWLFITDAATGQILYQEDQMLSLDVAGNVSGMASQGPGADICAAEAITPMFYARANIGATQVFADVNGDFVIPNAGTAQVTVQSPVRGQRFVVNNLGGASTVLSQNVIPPGPADFVHNQANNDEFIRAEVNAFVSANIVRDFTLFYNPSYPTIGGQTEFSITVNEPANTFCPGNAQYQGNNLRFCASGPSRPNTAWSSVVYHEYGHHLVQVSGSGQGEYGEGMGDVMSVLILDVPELGVGFFGSCNLADALRDADNTCQYAAAACSTCGSEIHDCGQLISGCVWDTRNQLAISNPLTYIDILSPLAIDSMLLHTGSGIASDITVDYLTLDDDDANINNGTPHSGEICTGFGAHGMNCPAFDPIGFSYPNGRPETVIPNQPVDIRVDVVSLGGTPIAGSGTVSYRIGNSGPFTTVAMSQIVANQYNATLPGADCGETIQYYVSADAVGGSTFTDPPGAPSSVFSTTSATGMTLVLSYDFETNPGWTVSGNATDGQWNRGTPIGGGDRGDPPADHDGSGQCWLTDNVDGNSDVDGGTTTLMSGAIDLSTLIDPRINYARWYSNTNGAAPEADIFVVEASGNNGASWVNVETVGPTGAEVGGGWFVRTFRVSDVVTPAAQTRVRYHASDLGSGSVVEAGVDAFEVWDVLCQPCTDPCDDGNPCTLNDVCTGPNVCAGTPVDCSGSSDQCNTASCNITGPLGNCTILTPVTNGTSCDDGAACNVGEICLAGTCAGGGPPNCSAAGDQCNTASCDDTGADGNCDIITPIPNGTTCNDGNPCNLGESCQTGACSGGTPPDCSAAGDECNTASCNAGGATGNCDSLTPLPDGTSCDGGFGICDAGACVPDPGDNRVFMVRPGEEATALAGQNTTITMQPGSTVDIEVWAADTEPQLLGGYQIALPGSATPVGGTGTVSYVDGAGTGVSVLIDTANPDWVFFPDAAVPPFYSEIGLPEGFAMLASKPLGEGTSLTGLAYLGEFQLEASSDACNAFTVDFIPDGSPPNGGSAVVDETGMGPIYATYQPLDIIVGAPNNDCVDANPISGDDVSEDFTSLCADQDGTAHACGTLGADIWYAYTATCTGDLAVSTETNCTFDTALAVYAPGAGCVPTDGQLDQCVNTPAACETIETTVVEGQVVMIRVGSVAGQSGAGTLTVTCTSPCAVVEDCGDTDLNGITDDLCAWYACQTGVCLDAARPFGDAGGAFGACPPDGFANVHDRNHALACFAGTNPCDALNHDLGGPFGDCAADGFCNIHDANHALTAFSGTTLCSCPAVPSPSFEPNVTGHAALTTVAGARAVAPGGLIQVDVFIDGAAGALSAYQLELVSTGGRSGRLDLIDITVADRQDAVFANDADRFDAVNVNTSRMLAGLNHGSVATARRSYLATFTYRASKDAVGVYVVDVLHNADLGHQTFLVGPRHTDEIAVETTSPAVVTVTTDRTMSSR